MNIDDLLIHQSTRKSLQTMLSDPPQALLLSGPRGVGTLTVATAVAAGINGTAGSIQVTQPDEKGTITIETVRNLYIHTRSRSSDKKIFIIDDVDAMGNAAQNAFLKLLEEPNKSTVFILTTHDESKLLSTIRSRLQYLELKSISRSASLDLLTTRNVADPTIQAQILFMASGLPAEIIRLTSDSNHLNDRLKLAGQAKQSVSGSRYDQLVLLSSLATKPRAEVQQVLLLTIHMLKAQLHKNPDDTLLDKLAAYMNASEKIENNGHIRTQLMRTIK